MATLYDALTRHQVYLEGVKHWQASDFNQTLDVVRDRVGTLILNTDATNLGDMTTKEYKAYQRRISEQLDRTLTRSKQVLLSDLEKLSNTNNKVLRAIYGDRLTRRRLPTDGSIWSSVQRRILGATGDTFEALIDTYYASLKNSIVKELRKARVNNSTPREFYNVFRGTRDAMFKDGLLNRFRNQANTVISTAIQHISTVAQDRYGSIFGERYRWVSVIDNVTTDVCRHRDGKTYIYGKGPLPPAHHNCRSTTVPEDSDTRNDPANYFEWLGRQPFIVLQDIVGTDKAQAIKDGKAKKVDYPKFTEVKKLPIDELYDKLKFIVA